VFSRSSRATLQQQLVDSFLVDGEQASFDAPSGTQQSSQRTSTAQSTGR
jgi:hypothetical protein